MITRMIWAIYAIHLLTRPPTHSRNTMIVVVHLKLLCIN